MEYVAPYLIQRIEAMLVDTDLPVGLAARYQAGSERTLEERRYINLLIPLDYMGSAEFEFNAIPNALRELVQARADFTRFEMELTGKTDDDSPLVQQRTVKVYGLARKTHIPAVKRDVKLFAATKHNDGIRTKEKVGMNEGFFGTIGCLYRYKNRRKREKPLATLIASRNKAWFDLENLWFVGTDKVQVDRFAQLVGVP